MAEGGREDLGAPDVYLEKGERSKGEHRPAAVKVGRLGGRVRKDGTVVVPSAIAKRLGLAPGARLELDLIDGRLEIRPDIHSLARVYIEPTSRCGLSCRTCVRNTWTETTGDMDPAVFERLARHLRRFPSLRSVMFGGIGEPTLHPDITAMVAAVKALGLRAEMTTNGTSLITSQLDDLRNAELDMLWISMDGATEASFEDIRGGASFKDIVAALQRLRRLNGRGGHRVEVGIAFVLMKRNLADLKDMDKLARTVGARRVSVSHVLPYSAEMEKEMLCLQTLTLDTFTHAAGKTEISLPRLDINNATKDTLFSLLQGYENLTFMGNRVGVEARRCRFVHDRTTFVRWDGQVAPCPALLHTHKTFLYGLERAVLAHHFGDIRTDDLRNVWRSPAYAAFREKVRDFDFSPCHLCGGCSLLEKNEEDCYGNTFPACGGCLWAQGIIQCP